MMVNNKVYFSNEHGWSLRDHPNARRYYERLDSTSVIEHSRFGKGCMWKEGEEFDMGSGFGLVIDLRDEESNRCDTLIFTQDRDITDIMRKFKVSKPEKLCDKRVHVYFPNSRCRGKTTVGISVCSDQSPPRSNVYANFGI